MIRLANHRRPLGSLVRNDDAVSKRCSNLLQCLLLGFPATVSVYFVKFKGWGHLREKEVGNDEEEEGTSHEDIVVVLLDVGKCTGSGLGDWFRGLLAMALP